MNINRENPESLSEDSTEKNKIEKYVNRSEHPRNIKDRVSNETPSTCLVLIHLINCGNPLIARDSEPNAAIVDNDIISYRFFFAPALTFAFGCS